jgi:hypothetical protein
MTPLSLLAIEQRSSYLHSAAKSVHLQSPVYETLYLTTRSPIRYVTWNERGNVDQHMCVRRTHPLCYNTRSAILHCVLAVSIP